MSKTVKIEEASAQELRAFAERMGLETKPGHNSKQLIALIHRADSSIEEIPAAPEEPQTPTPMSTAAAPIVEPAPMVEAQTAGGTALMPHFSKDPRVELTVHKTSDSTRSKDVTVGCNGDVFRIQRGQRVSVPYRVYLTLEDAREMQAVETGEERMGVPVREWQEVYSYPFTVHTMPSDAEIAAWRAATDGASASASRARRAA